MIRKRCRRCGARKTEEEFYVRANGRLSSWCKACVLHRSHAGRGRGYRSRRRWRRSSRKGHALSASLNRQPIPSIAPLRLMEDRCAYAHPRGKVHCWRGLGLCAKPRSQCCPWLAGA